MTSDSGPLPLPPSSVFCEFTVEGQFNASIDLSLDDLKFSAGAAHIIENVENGSASGGSHHSLGSDGGRSVPDERPTGVHFSAWISSGAFIHGRMEPPTVKRVANGQIGRCHVQIGRGGRLHVSQLPDRRRDDGSRERYPGSSHQGNGKVVIRRVPDVHSDTGSPHLLSV